MTEDTPPVTKRPPTADELVAWYQERYCRPCGAGCEKGSVPMALCIQARLAQPPHEKPKKGGDAP